nr:histidine kinase [Corynebacterium lujinxingii]
MDAHRLQQQIEDERERAVLALHGSVASSLTSVVLRSEALAMSGDPQISEAAQLIASDARRSMQEVRDLIRFMRDDSPTAPQDSAPHVRLLDAFTNLAADLRAHGFPVVETGLTENVLGTAQLEPAARVCRELATNILKYGDASRPVVIAALQGEDELTVAVQNTIASQQRDTHMSTGIGLEEAQQLAAAHGASLTWHAESGSWRYELAVPR